MLKHFFTLLLGGILLMTQPAKAEIKDPENTLYMQIEGSGTVTIELRPDLAPKHVERMKKLTREDFFSGIVFHRVIEGFMAQTGDPTGTGMGGSDYPDIEAEFSSANFGRGVVGMARAADPNSANSQFFICFDDCSFLNGQYTIWGEVTDGMEFVDGVARGEPPASPDKIARMVVAADLETKTEEAPAEAETPAEDAAE